MVSFSGYIRTTAKVLFDLSMTTGYTGQMPLGMQHSNGSSLLLCQQMMSYLQQPTSIRMKSDDHDLLHLMFDELQ